MVLKRFCDKCNKELDMQKNYNDISISTVTSAITSVGSYKRTYQAFSICSKCLKEVLKWIKNGQNINNRN